MLRRAPTSISLSNRDVMEHLEHIRQCKVQDRENIRPQQEKLPAHSVSGVSVFLPGAFCSTEDGYHVFHKDSGHNNDLRLGVISISLDDVSSESAHNETLPQPTKTAIVTTGQQPSLADGVDSTTQPYVNFVENKDLIPFEENDDGFISLGVSGSFDYYAEEPPQLRPEQYSDQYSQFPTHQSEYGAFRNTIVDGSSSFVPQETSTPRDIESNDVRRLRARLTLPRSPLFRSYGADLPERRLTTSLTPRVASYGTPGLLLSQPPRRPRTYRARTVSYSFEESERTNATSEVFLGSEEDLTRSQASFEERRSLEEESGDTSSQSTSVDSDLPSSPPYITIQERSTSRTGPTEQVAEENRHFYFSSPQLPLLPPPFSAVSRSSSPSATLPTARRGESHSRTLSTSPPRSGVQGIQASPATDSPSLTPGDGRSSPGSSSIVRNLANLPLRLLTVYRSRSPFQPQSEINAPRSASETPRRRSEGNRQQSPRSTIRRRPFQIYDERRPPDGQPETPDNLPEARHQSRFHPSYTAPAHQSIQSPGARRSGTNRQRGTRSDSPVGMETPGFRGLYGGQENTDEEVMFDRAAQRLWALSARRNERVMSSTPEPEASFTEGRRD